MIIKCLNIKNFGRLHEEKLEFSPGINVLYGKRDSATVRAFLRGMLYGFDSFREKMTENDRESGCESLENKDGCGGTLWFSHMGKSFRLMRNLSGTNVHGELLCENDGSLLDPEQGAVEGVLGVGEAVYDHTVFVARPKVKRARIWRESCRIV